jgi:hypothetical protein
MLLNSDKPGNKSMETHMETVIQVVRGDPLDTSNKHCIFCGRNNNTQIFSITVKLTYDGTLIKGFPICEEHLSKLNALLSGEFDIDKIELEAYRKAAGKAVRFRG